MTLSDSIHVPFQMLQTNAFPVTPKDVIQTIPVAPSVNRKHRAIGQGIKNNIDHEQGQGQKPQNQKDSSIISMMADPNKEMQTLPMYGDFSTSHLPKSTFYSLTFPPLRLSDPMAEARCGARHVVYTQLPLEASSHPDRVGSTRIIDPRFLLLD